MRKIIKSGKTEFVSVCSRCGCEFSYEIGDIADDNYVRCPECNGLVYHVVPTNTDFYYQNTPYSTPYGTPYVTVDSISTHTNVM